MELELGNAFWNVHLHEIKGKRLLLRIQNNQDDCIFRLTEEEIIKLRDYLDKFIKESTDDGKTK